MLHRTSETTHAVERRCERGIQREWIVLCQAKGTRVNVPNDEIHKVWRHKFMFHGLHVVADIHSKTVITAYWVMDDDEAIRRCRNIYLSEVAKRNRAKQASRDCTQGKGVRTSKAKKRNESRAVCSHGQLM